VHSRSSIDKSWVAANISSIFIKILLIHKPFIDSCERTIKSLAGVDRILDFGTIGTRQREHWSVTAVILPACRPAAAAAVVSMRCGDHVAPYSISRNLISLHEVHPKENTPEISAKRRETRWDLPSTANDAHRNCRQNDFYIFFDLALWILAQFGPQFNGINPERLPVYSEGFCSKSLIKICNRFPVILQTNKHTHATKNNTSPVISTVWYLSVSSSFPAIRQFFLGGNDKGLRGHSKKICKVRFNTDVRKYFFLKSSHWQMEQFGPGHCRCTQPELFHKNTLNKIRSTRMCFFMD